MSFEVKVNRTGICRIRKGKACIQPQGENPENNQTLGLLALSARGEMLNRPLIRSLSSETKPDSDIGKPTVAIPPPPAKHFERERYFKENKVADGNSLRSHMRGLSLHSRNASSSRSGSIDFSD